MNREKAFNPLKNTNGYILIMGEAKDLSYIPQIPIKTEFMMFTHHSNQIEQFQKEIIKIFNNK